MQERPLYGTQEGCVTGGMSIGAGRRCADTGAWVRIRTEFTLRLICLNFCFAPPLLHTLAHAHANARPHANVLARTHAPTHPRAQIQTQRVWSWEPGAVAVVYMHACVHKLCMCHGRPLHVVCTRAPPLAICADSVCSLAHELRWWWLWVFTRGARL